MYRIILILVVFICMGGAVQAQVSGGVKGHGGYCDQAESTASIQRCLKRHLDSAQRRLNVVYKKLGATLEGEKLEELKELQQTWLRYRDAECMWESAQTETPSLKRVHELSCMARVTEDRADLLGIVFGDVENPEAPREYGTFPRWMNALVKDRPGIYWDYGGRKSYDLNCDGEDEFIMEGVQLKREKLPAQEQEDQEEGAEETLSAAFSGEKIVAIVQNPPLGRPKAEIFTFPVMEEETTEGVCQEKLNLVLEGTQEEANEESGEEQAQCHATLTLKDKNCMPKTILWTGKKFALQIKEETETK